MRFTVSFQQIDKTTLALVGGKGANLGELSKVSEIHLPEGFCITTDAYKDLVEKNQELKGLLSDLMRLKREDRQRISQIGAMIREIIEAATMPGELIAEIEVRLKTLGEKERYAVRSSATAEDLPTASFAGQQDTYLNIIGREEILKHISKCWASLFTDRAIIYRIQNHFDQGGVFLSVIIQKMVFPEASGILFTADPVTSNRKILSIDASFGLGEALVSGIVSPDCYKVRKGKIVDKIISTKKLAIYALRQGGTETRAIRAEQQNVQALNDQQILELSRIGRQIETHFGCPQDMEWCLAGDTFYIVQSRPITTLYPIPEINDGENHVYVSTGHQQMMTDAMKPLGISVRQHTSPRPMFVAGGRMFVDVTTGLASPATRQNLLDVLGQSDPLITDALVKILERGDFIKSIPADKAEQIRIKSARGMTAADILAQVGSETSIVTGLIEQSKNAIAELKNAIQNKSGADLFDFIADDLEQWKKMMFESKNMGVILAAMNASIWINEKMKEWLGEKNVADILTQSVPNNVTSEMGLELLDVADVIRPYPKVIGYLQTVDDDNFLDGLEKIDGGAEARRAIADYLDKYGMRCVGEIDITKTRWCEKPIVLVPLLLSNIKNFRHGAATEKFEKGRKESLEKEEELLHRVKTLPDGDLKARETKQIIGLIRNFAGYREYPKYGIVSRYLIYKMALLKEARRLLQDNIIHNKEDIYYLTFEEFRDVVRTNKMDYEIINKAKAAYQFHERLNPPRVLTSDGEIISGQYNREHLPEGAIVGLPVSSGIIEGRARVILDMNEATLEKDDILVTTFTDPSWTPVFVSIKGLVTEVGGLMTHGAVIAREYGLPAVVGVENATKLISDGQRIRVNGTDGYVELL